MHDSFKNLSLFFHMGMWKLYNIIIIYNNYYNNFTLNGNQITVIYNHWIRKILKQEHLYEKCMYPIGRESETSVIKLGYTSL